MKVNELMVRDVKSCSNVDSTNRAAQLMWENDCGFVVVLSEAGLVAGVITDRDICMAAYTTGRPLCAIPVNEVMSRDVKCCGPDDDIQQVTSTLRAHQVRRLPVVDGQGIPVGVISLNDLACRAAADRGLPVRNVSQDLLALTLADLCRPRTQLPEVLAAAVPSAVVRRAFTDRVPQLSP